MKVLEIQEKWFISVEPQNTTYPSVYPLTLVMTPTHKFTDYLFDAGPWEFPFEVQITEKAKTEVV